MNEHRWAMLLGGVFAVVALSLMAMTWSRLGQSKLLTKCAAVALLAHVWLILYAYSTRLPGGAGAAPNATSSPMGIPAPANILWSSDPEVEAQADSTPSVDNSGDQAAGVSTLAFATLSDRDTTIADVDPPVAPIPDVLDDSEILALMEATEVLSMEAAPSDLPQEPSTEAADLTTDTIPNDSPSLVASAELSVESTNNAVRNPHTTFDMQRVPATYRMRFSPDRMAYTLQQGGDDSTEFAVRNALAYLARTQQPNGSWPVAQEQPSIGRFAHTAMTGLAVLAFLGAGHSHLDGGPYAQNIQRGLDFLRSEQFPSGDLSGRLQIGQDPNVRFSRMYSHAMAGLAISEAYAITADPMLLDSVQGGVRYTLNAMNPRTGGWRYDFATDDPGDTSQFGWQAMLLNSAQGSGAVPLRGQHRVALQRFLDSVTTGTYGGLAVYRNVTPDRRAAASQATAPMTAEALAIRAMMDFPFSAQALGESQSMILKQLPGESEVNFYYWYYATLALYQSRGRLATQQAYGQVVSNSDSLAANRAWETWNASLKSTLLRTQVTSGINEGSWDPNCVWGQYAGRTYSTAIGCLCLEVYYRYLPVIEEREIAKADGSNNPQSLKTER
ncbi:MAG: hypothetical protein RL240_432 [Planctomycetota bacterium]